MTSFLIKICSLLEHCQKLMFQAIESRFLKRLLDLFITSLNIYIYKILYIVCVLGMEPRASCIVSLQLNLNFR